MKLKQRLISESSESNIPGEELVSQHCLLLMEGQEESKIQKEIETLEVERVRGERRVC